MNAKRAFVLLIGNKERGEINHFQLLQEETAQTEGRRLGIDVEVAFAPGFDQLRVMKRRLVDAAAPPLDAVVTEPASTSTMDLMLRELKGKTGLVILSAWGPSIEENAASWGAGLPLGNVSTDHTAVGEIQGSQVRALLPEGGRLLCIAGPARASAAQQRLEGLKSRMTDQVELQEIAAGAWTESDGIVAFNDWYRVAKARDPIVQVVAGGNDELALGARRACEALADSGHRDALLGAKFLGVDGCPTFGQKLVEDGTLAASVVTPANTGLALEQLSRFWKQGTPMPLRSYTKATPLPAGSTSG
ncbi:MAG: substrate-binding domain-containing protein [Acidobacteria bacterium]|jgi:ribose transport system substrate-binding protein|nr:substrate-binding domain-containing protein [Acidobacteriota bacterium]